MTYLSYNQKAPKFAKFAANFGDRTAVIAVTLAARHFFLRHANARLNS